MNDMWTKALALGAIIPAGAALWFVLFWNLFEFWRRHRALTYAAMGTTVVSVVLAAHALEHLTWFGGPLVMPVWARTIGWALIAVSTVFGWIADRQIGVRVRSFAPFFDRLGRIELKTTGAYGVVRHPIYAAGRVFQFGVFLVTGYPSVLLAWAVFGFGAIWFTRQEERRLVTLLDDPASYDRYRARVPALFPFLRPRMSEAHAKRWGSGGAAPPARRSNV